MQRLARARYRVLAAGVWAAVIGVGVLGLVCGRPAPHHQPPQTATPIVTATLPPPPPPAPTRTATPAPQTATPGPPPVTSPSPTPVVPAPAPPGPGAPTATPTVLPCCLPYTGSGGLR